MKPRIAVVGEAFTDVYWAGTASRLSPEAPVPVVKITGRGSIEGGAANVYENVLALGAQADAFYPPGVMPRKNRLMVGNTQLARWDEDDLCRPLSWDESSIKKLKSADGVILSDYGKGAFSEQAIARLSEILPRVPIFIDTKQSPLAFSYIRGTVFVPNKQEYDMYAGEYDTLPAVITKLGAEGIRCHIGPKLWSPSMAKHVVSVNGAGDTVIAALAYAYLIGMTWQQVLDFSMAAAAVVCQKPYTSVATAEEAWKVYDDNTVLGPQEVDPEYMG